MLSCTESVAAVNENLLQAHAQLTPLISTQPEEDVPTAAASEQNGLEGGWEGVEAMEMVR